MRRLDKGIIGAVLVGVAVGLMLSGSLDWMNRTVAQDEAQRATLQKKLDQITKGAQAFTQTFPQLAKLVRPSVVTIYTEKKVMKVKRRQNPKELREYWKRYDRQRPWWFNENIPKDLFEFRVPENLRARGQGSGVIIDKAGHILTNGHVVRGMDEGEIKVKLYDGREYNANIVAIDSKTDLAVIKINAKNLVPAKFGDSRALEVGEWVVSVGSPFGLEQSVSAGIISAKGRRGVNIIRNQFAQEDFLQTDAGVNPGNSGGPLVNLHGEVVGICTAIATRSRGDDRVGFAIPSHIASYVMKQLIEKKKVTRGYIGVAMFSVADDDAAKSRQYENSADLRKKLKLKSKDGVYVDRIMSKSPADQAGILPQDVITEFDGAKITDSRSLCDIVRNTPVGKKVKVGLIRGGKQMDVQIVVGEQPEGSTAVAQIGEGQEEEPQPSGLGVTVIAVTPELAEKYQLDDGKGVVVTRVEQGSPAYGSLMEGDLIQKVNGKAVTTVDEFKRSIKPFEKGELVTLIVRNKDGLRAVRMRQSTD
ncbi:MAG: PDZ domain-containing protein [Planctomycetes bacterium]|nr:PDZ domain-containing protein [Planctomycetota bacterium]